MNGPCSSAHTSAAGSTTITPSSETVRSTTVTIPKSLSILMSDATSAAKPAMAVAPEASTADPVDAYARSSALAAELPWRRSSW